MKGGYQTLDLSGIEFSTDSAGARVTDTDFIEKFNAACDSGKPILVDGFGNIVPAFANVSTVGAAVIMSVTSAINPEGNGVGVYIIKKMRDFVTAYYKQYTLS